MKFTRNEFPANKVKLVVDRPFIFYIYDLVNHIPDASVENNQVVVVDVVKAHSHLLQPKLIEKCIALKQM